MDQDNYSQFQNYSIENLQLEFIKTLGELRIKKQQLEEYRNQMAEITLKQHELEHHLVNEKRKNANDEFNTILMKSGNEALETERRRVTKELAIIKSRSDMISAERNYLYEEVRVQALANLKLKETILDLERKHQTHLLFQSELEGKLEKIISSIKTIMPTIVILQQKQENLLEMFDDMNKFETLKLTIKQIEKRKEEAEKKLSFFENKYIAENAECLKLHELLDSLSITKVDEETKLISLWKDRAMYLETQLYHEKEKNQIMENTLRIAIENENICRKTYKKNENIETSQAQINFEGEINYSKNTEIKTDV